jgi:heme exporter protein CcmD
MSDPYLGFIVAAYSVAAAVVAAMIGGIWLDRRLLQRKLDRLAERAANGEAEARRA